MPRRPEAGRIASLVGESETDAYIAIHGASTAFIRATGDRFFGGGGLVLLDPKEVTELGGDFRPGLVAFAHESAGDWVCWDLRKGRPTDGSAPRVVYVDHELGLARPFARDVRGALAHVLALALIGTPKHEIARCAAEWSAHFGPVVGPVEKKLIASFAERVAGKGKRPVFAREDEAEDAVRALLPGGKTDWGMLPPTHVPLLAPDDPACVDEAIERYEDSAAVYREMVHDEGRAGYAWHLASALRGLSDMLLRRGKLVRAAKAAREAIEHYEPILERGDGRVATMLAFVHRVVAVVEARGERWASAYEHSDRALALSETALLEYARGITALGYVGEAWERELAGEDPHEVQIRLDVAVKQTADFLDKSPPHVLGEHAARVARLAAHGRKRRRRRNVQVRTPAR